MSRPDTHHNTTRETQSNVITLISTLSVLVVSRRPIFFGVAVRLFSDELMCSPCPCIDNSRLTILLLDRSYRRRASRRSDEILWEEEPLPSPETTFTEQSIAVFGWNTTSTKAIPTIKKEIARVLAEDRVEIQLLNDRVFHCRVPEKSVLFEVEVANLPRFSVSCLFLAFLYHFPPSNHSSLSSLAFLSLICQLESAWYPFKENSRQHVGLHQLCQRIRLQAATVRKRQSIVLYVSYVLMS